ncbi:hypothetical protein AB835_06595 [Candidatus Endobugula sertula]|uniref:2-oxoacid dehydrogenase acyltransferase catalytic domain-containing protein n=1 Tax=Candidatus Endobugula sertula TaxID=62101 RepID=A0A1D2QQT0_9GAMM|nr:hypothetical protein AB835_06595 [Candidatus Endobugula sertula]
MKNIHLKKIDQITEYRKFSIATWKSNHDPNTSTVIELRMEKALDYMKVFRKKNKHPAIILHLVIKAVAAALSELPEANVLLRFNKFYYRSGATISASVVDKEGELYNIRIENTDKKSLLDIVKEVNAEAKRVRETDKTTGDNIFLPKMPSILYRPFLWIVSFLMFKLNINLSFMRFPKDAFGVAEVTYIGALGLDNAVLPLSPYINVPFILGPGIIKDAPVIENGEVKVGKVMNLSISFDHRYIDGFHGAKIVGTLKRYLENPFENFDGLSIDDHEIFER